MKIILKLSDLQSIFVVKSAPVNTHCVVYYPLQYGNSADDIQATANEVSTFLYQMTCEWLTVSMYI